MADDGVDRILEQWARERPDLDAEAMGIFGRIQRIARAAGDAATATYAQFGITRGDFDVLATLRRAGEPFALSPSALSASLMLTSGGITQRVDRLDHTELVTRTPDPSDRRGQIVALTSKGRDLVDAAVTAGLKTQQQLLDPLGPDTRRELDRSLRQLLAAVTSS
jgi:DNA-binding MarR family transcriptional regulator